MKKYSTRTLSLADFPSVERVITSRDYFSSIDRPAELKNAREFHLSHTYNLLDADVQNAGIGRVFGTFDGDTLTSLLVSLTSDYQANYYIVRAHTLKGEAGGPGMLSALIGSCIKYHEQHGYFRFYTVYTANKLKAYKRLWDERATVSKYTSFTEVEVGANEKVKQAEFWEKLYGRLLLPEPSIVRGFIRPMGDAVIRI